MASFSIDTYRQSAYSRQKKLARTKLESQVPTCNQIQAWDHRVDWVYSEYRRHWQCSVHRILVVVGNCGNRAR